MGKSEHNRKRYAILAAGLVLLWPNLQHSFFRMSLTGRLGEDSLSYYGVSLVVITVCSVLFFLFHARAQEAFAKRTALVPVAAGAALVSTVTIMALPYSSLPSESFHAIAIGAIIVWSAALCIIFFAWLTTIGILLFELDMRIVIGIAATSGVLGFFLIPVMLFDTVYYRAIAAAGLCASGLLWWCCNTGAKHTVQAKQNGSDGERLDVSSLRHFGVLFLAYLLASILHAVFYALDAGIDLEMYTVPCYVIVGTFGLIIAFSTLPGLKGKQTHKATMTWSMGVVMSIGLFIGLFLAMALFDFSDREANLNFMSAANRCLQILIFVSLLLLVYQQKASPIIVFALLFMSVEVLSNLICYFIAPAVIGYFQLDAAAFITMMSSIIGAILIAALVFSLVVFAMSDSMKTIAFERGSAEEQHAQDAASGKQASIHAVRCAEIAARYLLTQREQDVLYYLSLGYNARRIAETLFVSFETVRSHTSGIYRKMAVHSKQELIDIVNESTSQDEEAMQS